MNWLPWIQLVLSIISLTVVPVFLTIRKLRDNHLKHLEESINNLAKKLDGFILTHLSDHNKTPQS